MGVKLHSRYIPFFAAYLIIAGGLWAASQWWEKGLATSTDEIITSPNKCYRIQSYKPFWVLPTFLHPWSHPDKTTNPIWFANWINPGFDRLYDNRNGALIGESEVYDFGRSGGGGVFWGNKLRPAVYAGMVYIGPNVPDCIGDQPAQPRPSE